MILAILYIVIHNHFPSAMGFINSTEKLKHKYYVYDITMLYKIHVFLFRKKHKINN